jgi:hypothetical protein
MQGHQWSHALNAETSQAIENGRLGLVPRGNELHMKRANGKFGTMAIEDLRNGIFRVVEKGTGEPTIFTKVDDLIDAGWVID